MKVTVKSSDNKKTEDVNLTVSSTSNRSYIASCIVTQVKSETKVLLEKQKLKIKIANKTVEDFADGNKTLQELGVSLKENINAECTYELNPSGQIKEDYLTLTFDNKLSTVFEEKRIERFTPGDPLGFKKKGDYSVYAVTSFTDQKQYAIKEVVLHIEKDETKDPLKLIQETDEYKEVQAIADITNDHIIRYYTSWFDKFSDGDNAEFKKYCEDYKKASPENKKKAPFTNIKRNDMLDKGKDFVQIKLMIQMELCEGTNLQ